MQWKIFLSCQIWIFHLIWIKEQHDTIAACQQRLPLAPVLLQSNFISKIITDRGNLLDYYLNSYMYNIKKQKNTSNLSILEEKYKLCTFSKYAKLQNLASFTPFPNTTGNFLYWFMNNLSFLRTKNCIEWNIQILEISTFWPPFGPVYLKKCKK